MALPWALHSTNYFPVLSMYSILYAAPSTYICKYINKQLEGPTQTISVLSPPHTLAIEDILSSGSLDIHAMQTKGLNF